jgi:hypothetical protein
MDGADLLQDEDNGERPWDRAITQCLRRGASQFHHRLAQYLPNPIPVVKNPDRLLDSC